MKNQIELTSSEISGLINGDRCCFQKVYEAYKDRVYYYALKLTRSDDLAEEITQDVFVKLWSNRSKIDLAYSFSSFVFRVTHNHAINILKRNTYEKVVKERITKSSIVYTNDTEDKVIYKEYSNLMDRAIDLLPPKRKYIFNLSRTKGVSHDEIASEMGISKNTVKSQLVKATKSIRSYLVVHADLAF
ncbi:MAG: RNA polymerase sigma-70 factor [Cyclobacteriaceae bacterium]